MSVDEHSLPVYLPLMLNSITFCSFLHSFIDCDGFAQNLFAAFSHRSTEGCINKLLKVERHFHHIKYFTDVEKVPGASNNEAKQRAAFSVCYYCLGAIVAQCCFNYQMIEGEPLKAHWWSKSISLLSYSIHSSDAAVNFHASLIRE